MVASPRNQIREGSPRLGTLLNFAMDVDLNLPGARQAAQRLGSRAANASL